jgi:hypothetical protein
MHNLQRIGVSAGELNIEYGNKLISGTKQASISQV